MVYMQKSGNVMIYLNRKRRDGIARVIFKLGLATDVRGIYECLDVGVLAILEMVEVGEGVNEHGV